MNGLDGIGAPHRGWAGDGSDDARVHASGVEDERGTVRVLVVDDHPAFRKALASALRLVGDVEVAGEVRRRGRASRRRSCSPTSS